MKKEANVQKNLTVDQLKQINRFIDKDEKKNINYQKSFENFTYWKNHGQPHVWLCVESENEYDVYIDISYGSMIVLHNSEIVSWGKNEIVLKDCVVLNKSYYGCKKYLWF